MLEGIKALINQKKDYLEAADNIFEDVSGSNLDDSIVLGEAEEEELEDEVSSINEEDEDDDELKLDPSEEGNDDDDEKPEVDDELGKEPELDEPKEDDNNNDPLDSNIGDGKIPTPGEDELPTPVGIQTGEPIEGSIDDILNCEIDIQSNTLKDVLPIPPSNAGDAISDNDDMDDMMNQRIDTGFESEADGGEPVTGEPSEDNIVEAFSNYMDALRNKCMSIIESSDSTDEEILEATRLAKEIHKAYLQAEDMIDTWSEIDDFINDNPDLDGATLKKLKDKNDKLKKSIKALDKKFKKGKVHNMDSISTGKQIAEDMKNGDFNGSIGKEMLKASKEVGKMEKDKQHKAFNIEPVYDTDPNSAKSKQKNLEAKKLLLKANKFLESFDLDLLSEAIDIGGGDNNSNQNPPDVNGTDDGTGVEDPTGAIEGADDGTGTQDQENDVTSAVRDKVNEADTGDGTSDGSSIPVGKETLLKKLGNITKNLEDAKKAIMDSM